MPGAFIRSFKVVLVSWWTRTDPGILDWGVQTLVQKGLLNFLGGKFLLTEMTTCFSIFERRSPMAREILLCSRLKQNPFLPVRKARGSQSQPYCDDGMITLKVLLKSVYTSQKYYLTMTLQRCIHAYVQYHLLSANTWFSMTNLLRIEKDNISEYCLSSSYFATVPRGFGFHETLVFSFVYHTVLIKIQGIVVLSWFLLTTKTSCTAEFKDLRHCPQCRKFK